MAVLRVTTDLTRLGSQGDAKLALSRPPTSIDNMSPTNRFVRVRAEIPVSASAPAHSVISANDDLPPGQTGDGVVKRESAHREGVASKLIARSLRSGMRATPGAVGEARRIFLEHAAASPARHQPIDHSSGGAPILPDRKLQRTSA